MPRSPLLPALQVSVRAALAAGISVGVAQAFGLRFPLYAMIGAVIVTDLSAAQTRRLAVPRLAGTVVGSALGATVSVTLGPRLAHEPWAIALAICASMFASQLLRLKDSTKVAGYVCGIVLLEHGAQPWVYGFHRLIETVLGIAAAVLVSLVPKLVPDDEMPHRPGSANGGPRGAPASGRGAG